MKKTLSLLLALLLGWWLSPGRGYTHVNQHTEGQIR